MAKKTKFYSEGLGLVPVSADPASPSQGQMQYSDGTARAEGLWRYNGTEWVRLGGSSGDIVSDYVSYSPTYTNFTLGNGSENIQYRRVGKNIEILGTIVLGSTSSVTGDMILSMPNGLSGDTSLMDFNAILGQAVILDVGVERVLGHTRWQTSSLNSFVVRYWENQVLGVGDQSFTSTEPFTWAAGDTIQFKAVAPIQGWSTGVLPNEISEGKTHAFSIQGSSVQSIPHNTETKLTNWATPNFDESAGWDATNNKYIAQESGKYFTSFGCRLGPDSDGDITRMIVIVKVNGVDAGINTSDFPNSNDTTVALNLNRVLNLQAGDEVECYTFQQNTDGDSVNTNGIDYQYFDLFKLNPLGSQITPAETVAARASSNSNLAIGTSATTLIFEDVDFDKTGSYNPSTGEYTVGISGLYSINAAIENTATSFSGGNSVTLRVIVNGSERSLAFTKVQTATTINLFIPLVDTLQLSQGDVVVFQGIASVATTTSGNPTRNRFAITKVGN